MDELSETTLETAKTDSLKPEAPKPDKRLVCGSCGHDFQPRKVKPYHKCDNCGSVVSRGKKVVAYFLFENNGGRLYE